MRYSKQNENELDNDHESGMEQETLQIRPEPHPQ